MMTRSPGKRGDGVADLVDDADPLVAEDAAWRAGRNVAFQNVKIGPADAFASLTTASVGAEISGFDLASTAFFPGPL